MAAIIPPARPNIDVPQLIRAAEYGKLSRLEASLIFVRGHYLNSMGDAGDDQNIYDDSVYLLLPDWEEAISFNANTNPSFEKKGGRLLALLNLGKYLFQKGKHRNRYAALRAFPEGVRLPVTRGGKPSTAQYINIHKGGTSGKDVTWSEGCLTIPAPQYDEFIKAVYGAMDKTKQKVISVLIVENRQTQNGQKWFFSDGSSL